MIFLFQTYAILINIWCAYLTAAFNSADILTSHHYPVEAHRIETRDGYILEIFRIPNSPRYKQLLLPPETIKPVFFLQHGMTASSDFFLLNGPDDGLPFMLADAGYDVWLGNARGNTYSRRHKTLNPNKKEFWKFSWHEIGVFDMPAMIEYVLERTRQPSLHYIGHSQGCTTFLVLMSLRPEFNKKIKTSHLLAPAAWMMDLRLPKVFQMYINRMSDSEFSPKKALIQFMIAAVCPVISRLCRILYFLTSTKHSPHMNKTLIPMLIHTHPASISTRQPQHYFQIHDSGKFRQYDFGESLNWRIYDQKEPPDYPLSSINPLSKVHIYYSKDDETTSARDVLHLASHLQSRELHLIRHKNWLHLDYALAMTVREIINIPILRISDEYENRVNGRKPIINY